MKINNFRGELTDISAKKNNHWCSECAALLWRSERVTMAEWLCGNLAPCQLTPSHDNIKTKSSYSPCPNILITWNFVLPPATEATPIALLMAAIVPAAWVSVPAKGSKLTPVVHHCGSLKLKPIVEVVVNLLVQLSLWPHRSGCLISKPAPTMQILLMKFGSAATKSPCNKRETLWGKEDLSSKPNQISSKSERQIEARSKAKFSSCMYNDSTYSLRAVLPF